MPTDTSSGLSTEPLERAIRQLAASQVQSLNVDSDIYASASGIRGRTNWSNASMSMGEQTFNHIKSHEYTPTYLFHKTDKEENLFFGAEIEIDNGGQTDDIAEYVVNLMGKDNVFCKQDGSLRSGFEIVTHPCSLGYHKTLPYEELFKYLSSKGYKAHDTTTCGLHIHVNRNYFGNEKIYQDLAISNFLYLFEKFWDKVVLIARRGSNNYAQRFYLKENETPIDMYVKSKNANKYGAINLQHPNTIEIRIYKGTLIPETFFNTLEFTKVFIELVKETSIYDIQTITWDDIYDRFSDQLKEYIKEREEKQPKEKAEEQRINTGMYSTMNYHDMCSAFRNVSFNNGSFISCGDYEDNTRSRRILSVDLANFVNPTSREDSIHEEMTELNRRIRSERNPLTQRNLQRELGVIQRELGSIRRNR